MASPVWNGGSWSQPDGHRLAGVRRVLAGSLYGARTSLSIGLFVVFVAGAFGVLVGLRAGYKGGRTDSWLMGWVDVQVSFPGLLLAMLLIALVGGSIVTITIILAINGWMVFARMTRGTVLSAKERPFVEAAEMVGCRSRRVVVHAHPAQPRQPAEHAGRAGVRPHHPRRGGAELPRARHPVPGRDLGLDIAARGDHELFGNQWLIIYPGSAAQPHRARRQPAEQLAAGRCSTRKSARSGSRPTSRPGRGAEL